MGILSVLTGIRWAIMSACRIIVLLLVRLARVFITRVKMERSMLFPTLIALASASVPTPAVKGAWHGARGAAMLRLRD